MVSESYESELTDSGIKSIWESKNPLNKIKKRKQKQKNVIPRILALDFTFLFHYENNLGANQIKIF